LCKRETSPASVGWGTILLQMFVLTLISRGE
jgi:hypothetical protein